MRLAHPKGLLFVIGGGEDKEGDCTILAEFVRLAGGRRARLVVMTVATDSPDELGREYQKVFRRLGAQSVRIVDVSARSDASDKRRLAALEQATGVFFTGGDQLHVTSLIGGSEMDLLLHQLYERGVIIGGTSAGAAMMSNSMFVRGSGEENPRLESLQLGPGVEFLLGGMIDTHFSQRGRHGRLISAVAQYPHDLGIGIDENTALVVKDGVFEVIGEGAVTVIDAGALTYTNVPDLEREEGLALYNIVLHILPAGHRFSLSERQPIIEKHTRDEIATTRVRRVAKPKTPVAAKNGARKQGNGSARRGGSVSAKQNGNGSAKKGSAKKSASASTKKSARQGSKKSYYAAANND
ncbi:MAG TPA: cyanophycinase [Pyrinomonadaceae bacterium]|nr:cyanophycinase [Pyrinomonadaceae bacterium]